MVHDLGAAGALDAPPRFRTGAWFRLRVQLLPDGRCGFAIDGRPAALLDGDVDTSRPFRAQIIGNSVRTRVLVGPVDIWEGVKDDIDWRVLDAREGARG